MQLSVKQDPIGFKASCFGLGRTQRAEDGGRKADASGDLRRSQGCWAGACWADNFGLTMQSSTIVRRSRVRALCHLSGGPFDANPELELIFAFYLMFPVRGGSFTSAPDCCDSVTGVWGGPAYELRAHLISMFLCCYGHARSLVLVLPGSVAVRGGCGIPSGCGAASRISVMRTRSKYL